MMQPTPKLETRLIAALTALSCATLSHAADFSPQQLEFFEKKVRPVLAQHCYKCHSTGSKKLRGKLRLDSRAGWLKGGESGPAIVPGDPSKSGAIKAIGYGDVDMQMPPKSKLPDAVIADLTEWVKQGAPWPDEAAPTAEGGAADDAFDIAGRKQTHWAWRSIANPKPPAVKNTNWPLDPVDRFILAGVEAKGLTPAPPADRRTLIRRAYFALIGMPPTQAEIEAFVKDPSPNAYENLIDKLLASPHFGERWARHWLDLMRYAESYGHEFDYNLPHAWRYRDYLIRAFNADLPYNQFITEHMAGDLLDKPRLHPTEGYNESVIGTGFWWLGEATHAPVDVRGDEAGRIDNQIDVFSKTFLGLTVACARCHDHKFDAISTKDYYALCGILQSSRRHEAMLDPHGRIAESMAKIDELRGQASAALVASVRRPGADEAGRFGRLLLAARAAMTGGNKEAALLAASAEHRVEAAELQRWVTALSKDDIKQPLHPLYAWAHAGQPGDAQNADAFVRHRDKVRGELKRRQDAFTNAAAATQLLGNFRGRDWGGWFADGPAFGPRPTRAGDWDMSAGGAAAKPGLANGLQYGPKARGVLRSQTFKLDKRQVHLRVNGRGVTIRLIIDGYFMEPYNGLLFRGTRLAKLDTKGQFKWVTLGGDARKYLGHNAYVEVIDHGDGYAVVDEVRLSDGGAPPDAPNTLTKRVIDDAQVNTLAKLAQAYGRAWTGAATQWHSDRRADMRPGDAALVNWAVANGLMQASAKAATPLADRLAAIKKQVAPLTNGLPAPVMVLAMTEGTPEDEYIHIRGSHRILGEPAPRRFLEALVGDTSSAEPNSSGRRTLARQLTDPAVTPQVPRVIVNRVWHQLFGRGIVASPDDTGVLGHRPTHPELLDHLAGRFAAPLNWDAHRDVETMAWSIKRLIRTIMLTQTYRMDSKVNPAAVSVDPDNLLWHRMPVHRLEGEAIRDAMLTISGRLDRKAFGPPVAVHLTGFMTGRGRPKGGPVDGAGRRSIYIAVRRNFLSPMMLAFDTPQPFTAIGRRNVSNVPAQALILMNDPFVAQQAQVWAKRVLATPNRTPAQRVTGMYYDAFARPPSQHELTRALAFLQTQGKQYGLPPERLAADARVWADLGHVLFNVKEFIYVR